MQVIRRQLLVGAREIDHVAVVIDVFRACTTCAVLLACGVKRVYLTEEVEEARQLAKDEDHLLAGEDQGRMPSGFDLGNSPSEILTRDPRDIDGRTAVLRTSGGTRGAVAASGRGSALFLGSYLTATATARAVRSACETEGNDRVTLVAVGQDGLVPSIEDDACADYLEHLLARTGYSHADVIRSLLRDPFIGSALRGELPYFPAGDVVLGLQRDLFDFALVASREQGRVVVTRSPCVGQPDGPE
jgi:2-phosphosulfolactate phosphatase